MTYYYQTGTVLPPQPSAAHGMQMLNEKPGLYGAYNGGVPVTVASRPVMSTGMQYFQTPGMLPGGYPPGSQVQLMHQPRHPGQAAAPPPSGFAMQAATPYPVSSAATAGYGASLQQPQYMTSAGLYQGASLAYPQPNMSPAAPQIVSGSPYGMGRSVSPYAGTQPLGNYSNSTYPGTVQIGSMMPGSAIGFPAATVGHPHPGAAQPQPPTYTISQPEVGMMPAPHQHMRAPQVATGPPTVGAAGPTVMSAQAAAFQQQGQAQGPQPAGGGMQSYPPGAIICTSPTGIPGMSQAMGAPLVANPNFPGASPYQHHQRGMP